MTILNAGVLTSLDDGHWLQAATFDGTNFTMVAGKTSTTPTHTFLRFDNLTLDAATINEAHLSVRAAANDSDATALRIYGVKEADPAAPTTAANADGRTLTTAFVNWNPGSWTSGNYVDSPDISAIVQELIDEGYIYSGSQAMMFFIKDNGSASNVNRGMRSYDHSSTASEPQLTVDYTPANDPPTIALGTADDVTMTTLRPTVEFTGSDGEDDDLRYQVQISERSDFAAAGSVLTAGHTTGGGGFIHPNPTGTLTWQNEQQVDDRPGQSFLSTGGGILDTVEFHFATDADTDGTAVARVYAHQGTFGTSSEPLNPADQEDTPTPGWLAESDPVAFSTPNQPAAWHVFDFSGANRIRLVEGTHYVVILDWLPNDALYDNTLEVTADTGLGHGGNAYIDGDSANNGVFATADVWFKVYEVTTLIDALSGTNAGFANTETPADTDPFNAGEEIGYTVQSGADLVDGIIYSWRVRVKDPTGSDIWSSWSATRSFDIDEETPAASTAVPSRTAVSIGVF